MNDIYLSVHILFCLVMLINEIYAFATSRDANEIFGNTVLVVDTATF